MSHVLVAFTDDEPGVLNRVASLFRRRAFNIHSLTVGPTATPGISRMTVVVETDALGALRAKAHLEKLVNVVKVDDLTHVQGVIRELALIRVAASHEDRPQLLQLAQAFRAVVVDIREDTLVLEATGNPDKLDALVDVLRPFGVLEVGRTGVVAMARNTSTPALPFSMSLSARSA